MSYLTFAERSGRQALVAGPAFRTAEVLAERALLAEIARCEYARLRDELGLPSPFYGAAFQAEVQRFLRGGVTVAGQRAGVFSVAQNVLYRLHPATGIMSWLYNSAIVHGWAAAENRSAMAGEIHAALDAGVADRLAGDQHSGPLAVGGHVIPPGHRGGWEEALAFLRDGGGDVVTSASLGDTAFPSQEIAERVPGWPPPGDPDDDAWAEANAAAFDALDRGQQWDACMPAIKADPGLQWKPGTSYHFGPLTLDRDAGLVIAPLN